MRHRLNYKDELKGTPSLVTGDGDGTVNLRSLESCKLWTDMKAQNNKPVHTVELEGADHLGILSDSRVLDYIAKLMVGIGYDRDYDADPDDDVRPRNHHNQHHTNQRHG